MSTTSRVKNMDESQAHAFTITFSEGQAVSIGGVIEATGLFVSAFVEGNTVQHPTFILHVESITARSYSIRADWRHGPVEGMFATSQAYATLYLIFVGWAVAGAAVEVSGPWQDSFPLNGRIWSPMAATLKLRHMFQDELPAKERTCYPSLEILAEIHDSLPQQAAWDDVQREPLFSHRFPQVLRNPKAPNNVRLHHPQGCKVDVVLKDEKIYSHIIEDRHPTIDISSVRFTCEQKAECARTWWDAWVGHCPTTDLSPSRLLVLPNEIAILLMSESIWRYQLHDTSTLQNPLKVDFGSGFHPTRGVEYWLSLANRFGEALHVDLAIGCCEQALATVNAMSSHGPGKSINPPLGRTVKQMLEEAEIEYLRWGELKESLQNPPSAHPRWNEKVVARGAHELTEQLGNKWEAAIAELVDAINQEHYHSEDYRHAVGTVREFTWNIERERGALRYTRLFGSDLMVAQVPKAAMAALGYNFSENVIPTHREFKDIFTLTLGKSKYWGSVERRALVSCSDPTRVYYV